MSYVTPTAGDFKARFPEFSAVDEARITAVINEALGTVNKSWIEADYQSAILYLTAHLLAGEGALLPSSVSDAGIAATDLSGPINNVKVGDVQVGFAGGGASAGGGSGGSSLYASTVYGRRFLALLRRSHPGVAVV